VVDGGGLEKQIAPFVESAIFRLNARAVIRAALEAAALRLRPRSLLCSSAAFGSSRHP
jgi:hypothetical protein